MRRLTPSPIRVLFRVSVLGSIALVVSGIGHIIAHPAPTQSRDAALLVESLADDSATTELVPAGFPEQLGYEPIPDGATLVNPNGGCSTPGGVGPGYFDKACRAHDLGYDTLRFAEGTGERLGPWARFDLDVRLYEDLLQTCETARCRATATAYFTAVTANSIRQGYQAPTEEPTAPWVGLAVGVTSVAMLTPRLKWGSSTRRHGPRPDAIACSTITDRQVANNGISRHLTSSSSRLRDDSFHGRRRLSEANRARPAYRAQPRQPGEAAARSSDGGAFREPPRVLSPRGEDE